MVGIIVVVVVAIVAIGAFVAMQPATPTTTTTTQTTTTTTQTTTTTTTTAKPIKVALISISPAGDLGWTDAAYSALTEAEEMGYDTAFTGTVADADLINVVTTYIDRGFNLILLASATFGPIIDASDIPAENPDVIFVGYASTSVPVNPNVIFFEFLREEGSFCVGALFTKLTQTNMVGSVGGIDYPVVVRSHEAFQAGVHWAVQGNWDTANPTVEVKTLYCGSWIDPAAGKISAQTLIQEGADCLVGQCDSSTIGVIDAAEEAGDVIISYNDYVGGFAIAPEIIVSTVAIRSDIMARMILENMEAGTIRGGLWRPALASGVVELAINPVWEDILTTEQKDYIEYVKNAIMDGDVEVPYVFEKSGVPPADF